MDVELGPLNGGKKARLALYKNDIVEKVALSFCKTFALGVA